MKQSVVLIILDGWGIGRRDETNPIHTVNPKIFGWIEENFPVTSLQASGIGVGLPWGEIGNSEVGHLTLGAGKVLYQYYPKINMAIRDKTFFSNPALKKAFEHARENNSSVNLAGLLTKANVHASLDHVQALLKMAELEKIDRIKIHLFSDGKDSPPQTAESFLKQLPWDKVATLTGRYYAMDRSQNWELTESAYGNITGQEGHVVASPYELMQDTYNKELTEEYFPPMRFGENKALEENDSLIFFNFREDSIRQLASSFILKNFDQFPTKKFKNLYVATMTKYRDDFDAPVAFGGDKVEEPLGLVLSRAGRNQLRLAESYKYAHITFFFNGYVENPFKNEFRVLVPSASTLAPEKKPEMMASEITDRLIEAIQNNAFDFILVNYANGDTIAHTADYAAGLEAVRTIGREIDRVLKVAIKPQTTIIITSDHGNAEEMISPTTGLPESQHDPNPVPFYLISPEFRGRKFLNWKNYATETMGSLADVAPTILEIMGIEKPKEMTGRSLLEGLF
ncbi:MAG: 2,3-bisphosphoglycerate-independent phosphoglycerate mutase [Patescibacteria group bacterium]